MLEVVDVRFELLVELEEMLIESREMLLVEVVLNAPLRNSPNPTIRIVTITMSAEIPRENAFFVLFNVIELKIHPCYLKLCEWKTVLTIRTRFSFLFIELAQCGLKGAKGVLMVFG
jgi:hypothetical protein